jgi:hypothetical protein
MTDQEIERRVTVLTLILSRVLDDAPAAVLARAMSEFPGILLTELRQLQGINALERLCGEVAIP